MPQEKIYPTERVGSFCWSEAGSEKVCEKGAKSLFTKLFAIVYVQAVFLHLKKKCFFDPLPWQWVADKPESTLFWWEPRVTREISPLEIVVDQNDSWKLWDGFEGENEEFFPIFIYWEITTKSK